MIDLKFTSYITVKHIHGMQMGSDTMIAAAAWVSTSASSGLTRAAENPSDVKGVINYLMKNRHGSPFEHGSLTMYVHAPLFMWREWHRHRIGWSYNEESARYHQLEPVFYLPPKHRPMFKVEGWKAGRPKFLTIDQYADTLDADPGTSLALANDRYNKLCKNLEKDYIQSYSHYVENLEMGFDPGLARDGLNVGIYSSCWVTCNPRSLMNFLSLRVENYEDSMFPSYPLWEIDNAARQAESLFEHFWPITHKAFVLNKRVAP